MAFGRLDIFWPDGRLESVTLDGQTVSVGRAAGNTVVLDTETVSRYHFSITHENDVVSITDLDSENGTYIDSTRLVSNEARVLDGVEEIQAGHLRIIYTALDETPTAPMPLGNNEDTQRIEVAEATFRLQVDGTHLDVWPAASSSAELAITNLDEEPQLYNVEVAGLPRGWARVNRPRLEVEPNETAYVLINIKPPRRYDNAPLTYPAQINVYADEHPEMVLTAPVEVEIHTFSGFGMALARPFIENREAIRLFLHNQGSGPLGIKLHGTSPDKAIAFQLPSGVLKLAPGQRMQVTGGVVPRQRAMLGQPSVHNFNIWATAQNNAGFTAAVSGKAEVAPRFKPWQLLAAGGIAVSILILGLMALIGLLAPRPPALHDLSVNSGQLAQGDTLILTWIGENLDDINIRVNQAPYLTLPGNTDRVEIDTSELSGDITLTVQGSGGGETVEASVPVYIYREMVVESFMVDPANLVRYVVTTITVSWDVPGATTVEINGLDAFTNAPIENTFGPTGQIPGISGVASGPIILALRAEDEVGNVIEDSFTLTVSDAYCIANTDVTLREGPNLNNQQIGTVPSGERVIIDAQDGGAAWLRVALPSGVLGWGQRGFFTCDAGFRVEELRAILDVPPPPPTASPTPILTATPTLAPPSATVDIIPTINPASTSTSSP
ncbi:MAG: hypothetical protein CL607_27265 [Anaerolineaceae bacterium]|nr:hypothetical protein [Anaerolineaceae bacterium]